MKTYSKTEWIKIKEFKKKLLKFKVDSSLGRLTNFSQIKKMRKEIARELTKISLERKNVDSEIKVNNERK